MARRGRKKKAAPITLAPSHIVETETDNPMFSRDHQESMSNPRRIKASFNMRESYVGWLWQKRLITDAEKKAADRVRHAFEALGGSGAKAIDYSKEPVDGGGAVSDITDRQITAGRTLREVHRMLGPQGHDLVMRMCGEGRWPQDMALDRRKRDYLSMRLRECLEHLAIMWGYQTRPVVSSWRAA